MATNHMHQPSATYLPSPSASATSSASTATAPLLPQMRSHPLVPGSQKEVAFIEYIDSRIQQIDRRYAKKFSNEDNKARRDEAPGYDNFGQCVLDLEAVFNIVWISGTPLLQVPYLLSLAGLLSSYLPAFPFAPGPTFRITKKLDAAFAYLLSGPSNSEGVSSNRRYEINPTEKVRIKSLVSSTRVAAIDVAEKSGVTPRGLDMSDEEDSDKDDEPTEGAEEEVESSHDKISVNLSKIFQQTVDLLGDELG